MTLPRPSRILSLAVAVAAATALPALPAPALPLPAPAGKTTTAINADVAMAARTDRRPMAGGVYDNAVRTTFFSWGGRAEDNYVQAYDQATGRVSAPVRIGDGGSDSHNYPTMVQAADGHLLVFRGMHNTELVMQRAPRAHSIEGAWSSTVIAEAPAATYPMPFRAADGTLFVFFRRTTGSIDPAAATDFRPMLYVRSTDDGKSWRSSADLTGRPFALGSDARADNMNETYFGQLRYDPARGRADIVWTLAGGGPEGHKHDRYHRNIYYAAFNPADLHFYAASGKDLGTRITDATQERDAKVADTPIELPAGNKSPDYIQLAGRLRSGRPFVIWYTADATGLLHDHAAVWTGRRWSAREVTTGLRPREMQPAGPDTWRVYASRDGSPALETYTLTAGAYWRRDGAVATRQEVQRVELITGGHLLLATGNSSGRDVAIADGDVYLIGAHR